MEPSPEVGQKGGKLLVPTVVETIVRELRALIVSGELKPGERLVEERLSERFGVSRPPLREALRILQQEGIVESRPRRGFRMAPIRARDIREMYSLRAALERMAVELGVPVPDDERLIPLRQALADIRAAAGDDQQSELIAANAAFHTAIIRLPGHSRLEAVWESQQTQLQMCMGLNLELRQRATRDHAESISRHERLLTLIESGLREETLEALAEHGDRSFLDQLDQLWGDDQ